MNEQTEPSASYMFWLKQNAKPPSKASLEMDLSFFSISVGGEMRALRMPCSTSKLHSHLMGSST